jgi:biopolymer transport protein ExbD
MRKRRTRDIVIELTSLLDVVMILIFAVMIENSKMVEASEAEVAAANVTMEEMRNELDEAEAEKIRLTEDYTVQLENRDRELQEIKTEAEETGKELDKAKEDYLKLSGEKEEISRELKKAQIKLGEGNVEELLARIANEELKNKSYEYLSGLIYVYNIGAKNVYEDPEDDEYPIYKTMYYGRAESNDEDVFVEYFTNFERTQAIETMKGNLVKGIDKALLSDDAQVYVIFTYNLDDIFKQDRLAIQNALTEITSKYKDRVWYKTIIESTEEDENETN